MASQLDWHVLSLNRRMGALLASDAPDSRSMLADIEVMKSWANNLAVSNEVRELYEDFVEMCVHLDTSLLRVYCEYRWTGDSHVQTHAEPHPDPALNEGSLVAGRVFRVGSIGTFVFLIGHFGRSYPRVVVRNTFGFAFGSAFCVHARADDPTLAIYDLRSVLSLTEASRTAPDMQKVPQIEAPVIEEVD